MRLVLALVLAASSAEAQNWPSFRGPNASGVAVGHTTATTWDATKGTGVLWKTAVPGIAVSSPIVWGDTRLRHDRRQQRPDGRASATASTATSSPRRT